MSTKNNKLRFIDEEKTKELQKDWKGYGKSQVLFGIVVFVIFVLSALYYYILLDFKFLSKWLWIFMEEVIYNYKTCD